MGESMACGSGREYEQIDFDNRGDPRTGGKPGQAVCTEGLQGGAGRSVSYTHLTLPTIQL